MTTQTVSLCNSVGGVALTATEAERIADLLHSFIGQPAVHGLDDKLLEQVWNVLLGRNPLYHPTQPYRLTGKRGRGWVEIEAA